MFNLSTTTTYVSSAIAGITALWGSLKLVVNPIINHFKKINTLYTSLDKLNASIDKLNTMLTSVEIRQKALLATIPQAVFECCAKGNLIASNKSYLNMLRADSSEVEGLGWKSYIYKQDRERVYLSWDGAVSDARNFSETFRYLSGAGEVICVTVEALAIKDNDKLLGYIGIVNRHESLEKCA